MLCGFCGRRVVYSYNLMLKRAMPISLHVIGALQWLRMRIRNLLAIYTYKIMYTHPKPL